MSIEIMHANCLDWLREQPTGCVSSVVTDPPYYLQGDANLSQFLNDVLAQCLRVARDRVVFICPLQWEFENQIERRKYPRYDPLPDNAGGWVLTAKGNRAIAPILVWRGESPGMFEIPLPIEALTGERRALKPVGLFTRLIRPCKQGTILDPFLGYGSCGEAARYLGHPFIGVENNREVYEDARKRLIPNSVEQKEYRDGEPGSWTRN